MRPRAPRDGMYACCAGVLPHGCTFSDLPCSGGAGDGRKAVGEVWISAPGNVCLNA